MSRRRYKLTPFERHLTHEALEYDSATSKARREDERLSVLSGYWEAMAVQAAMRTAAEGRGKREART